MKGKGLIVTQPILPVNVPVSWVMKSGDRPHSGNFSLLQTPCPEAYSHNEENPGD